ncbi:MAG: iron ABC transporter permease [Rhodospirillaceae bacterium]|nr:iron ABC transporter permease [Rhodospirillaceae bacterium]
MTRGGLLGALGVVTAAAFAASLALGPVSIDLGSALGAVFGHGPEALRLILLEIRLPRAILALAIGAALGMSGAALQGYLRNPLAEPGIVGISTAGALGAVIAFYFGIARLFPLALPLGGLLGAAVGVWLVYALAGRGGSTITLILAGVAVNALAGALTALALSLAPSPYATLEIIHWMLGGLTDRSMIHVWLALPFIALGLLLLATLGRGLDALSLGEEAAASMGIDVRGLRLRLILGTALAVGASTAVAGAIGFVGLVVPHLLRGAVGHRPGALLAASALGGGALTLVADLAARMILTDREINLGVLTAIIGAPFFVALVLQARRAAP